MLIIGESINGTIQKVGQAILDRNETFLKELARVQYEGGAYLYSLIGCVDSGMEVPQAIPRPRSFTRAEKRIRLGISNTGSINWLRATTGCAGKSTTASGSASGELRAVVVQTRAINLFRGKRSRRETIQDREREIT